MSEYYWSDYWFLSIPESCYGGSTNDEGLAIKDKVKIKEIKFKDGFPLPPNSNPPSKG